MIFIPGNVPSAKNSRMAINNKLIPNEATRLYKKNTAWYYIQHKNTFIKSLANLVPPYTIGFYFVRKSHHRFDFINALQIIQDIMVTSQWLEDDNTSILLPVPILISGQCFHYDPKNPGVYIFTLKEHPTSLIAGQLAPGAS